MEDYNNLPMILTPKDVIEFLKMPQDQVYRLFNNKKFPSERINSKHIITRPKFLKWLGVDQ